MTREVGQECLELLSGLQGGLLGVGHSWLTRLEDGGGGSTVQPHVQRAAAAGAASGLANSQAAAQDQPSTLRRLADLLVNAVEDLRDAQAQHPAGLHAWAASVAMLFAMILLGALALRCYHQLWLAER